MKTNITIKSIFRINITIIANSFIYFLKKMPLIKKLFPDTIYGKISLKKKLTIVFVVINYLYKLIKKFIYIILATIMPILLIFDELPSDAYIYFIQIFFGMSLVIGPLLMSTTLQNDREKYINIKLMRMNHRDYALSCMITKHLFDFILFIPAILIAILITGGPFAKMIFLIPQLLFARLIGEALLLFIFDKTKFNIFKKNILLLSIALVLMAFTYLSAFLFKFEIHTFLLSWYGNLIFAILGILACIYIFKYPKYRCAIENTIELNDLNVNTADILFNDVKIKDKEFDDKNLSLDKHYNKKGYDYLNAIFYERHKRLMLKPVVTVLYVIAIAFIGGIIALTVTKYSNPNIMDVVIRIFPITIFLMYAISNGAKSTKAMFYNCDVSLLNFSFYRKHDALLQNFIIRLKMLIRLNLMPSFTISVAIYILYAMVSGNWLEYRLLPYIVAINLLSIFFSVHYMLIYYLFQPYSSSYEIKSPIYNVINFVTYVLCFSMVYVQNTPSYFVIIVAGILVVYLAVAMILVKKIAPRTFRLK